MFIGEYEHILDTKGRFIIPSRFRESLELGFILTKGLDNCLFIYTLEQWEIIENKLNELPLTNKNARAFVRFFFSGASKCTVDKQGRVLIPPNLREHGNFIKDLVVIGVGTRIEIWSKEEWLSYNEDEDLDFDDIAEKMEALGI